MSGSSFKVQVAASLHDGPPTGSEPAELQLDKQQYDMRLL